MNSKLNRGIELTNQWDNFLIATRTLLEEKK